MLLFAQLLLNIFVESNKIEYKLLIDRIEDTLKIAGVLSRYISQNTVIFLKGDLGSGKTTFVKALLDIARYNGIVKSPSFTLMEAYNLYGNLVYHFDLYRLISPKDFKYIGIKEFLKRGIYFFEWPENGQRYLPPADLILYFNINTFNRQLLIRVSSDLGRSLLNKIKNYLNYVD